MINNFILFPFVPSIKPMRPPLLVDLMNSIVNFDKEDKIKISKLAENARTKIFDFDYVLSSKVNKEEFEKKILNHFIMRRIGYETYTAWHIAFENKITDILPEYNLMFDSLDNWNLFDGGITERTGTDDTKTNTENSLSSSSETNTTSDNRFSDMPQNQIRDIKSGEYVTEYTFNESNGKDNSKSNGNSNTINNKQYKETVKETLQNKIQAYNEFKNNLNHIYNMIYEELENLFYQIID